MYWLPVRVITAGGTDLQGEPMFLSSKMITTLFLLTTNAEMLRLGCSLK